MRATQYPVFSSIHVQVPPSLSNPQYENVQYPFHGAQHQPVENVYCVPPNARTPIATAIIPATCVHLPFYSLTPIGAHYTSIVSAASQNVMPPSQIAPASFPQPPRNLEVEPAIRQKAIHGIFSRFSIASNEISSKMAGIPNCWKLLENGFPKWLEFIQLNSSSYFKYKKPRRLSRFAMKIKRVCGFLSILKK